MASAGFADKVAVVTGGAGGIGAATVRAFAAAGAQVANLDWRYTDAEAADDRPDRIRAYAANVADPAEVAAALAAVARDFGGIDILVNNAGIGTVGTIETMPLADWSRVLEVNLSGPFHAIRAATPYMSARGGGAIINVASIAAKRMSYHGGANYTAAKSGLLGLTRHAAFELARDNIRVNAVCPGPVLTEMVTSTTTADERARTAELIPLGRWVLPDDVARVILFLAGTESGMCTGTSIDVDGGMLVSNGTPYRDYMARRAAPAAQATA